MTVTWDYPRPFLLSLAPGAGDIDGLNHTNNAVYVRWCEQIGWAHSESLGLGIADYRRLDRAMAIRRGEYDYILPTLLAEELRLRPGWSAATASCRWSAASSWCARSDGATVLRGRWELVCIDISGGRPRRMPPEFLDTYMPQVVRSALDEGGS